MKGHIRERSPCHWAIVIDVRDSQTGKRKRRWHSFAGNKRQAQVECARLISEMQGGGHVDPSRVTVAEFLDRFERDWLRSMCPLTAPDDIGGRWAMCGGIWASTHCRRFALPTLRAFMQPYPAQAWQRAPLGLSIAYYTAR